VLLLLNDIATKVETCTVQFDTSWQFKAALTFPPFPLEIHMAPIPVVDLLVAGFQLCFPRAHIDQQVQIALQQLHGEVIGLQLPTGLLLFGTLRTSVAEQQEAAGLRGAEVKGDGSRLLGVPLRQRDEGLGGLEGDGVQGRHVLAAEHQVAAQGDLGVALDGQLGQLQLEVVVLVHHLESGAQSEWLEYEIAVATWDENLLLFFFPRPVLLKRYRLPKLFFKSRKRR